jgi:hypothetical protein
MIPRYSDPSRDSLNIGKTFDADGSDQGTDAKVTLRFCDA